jgi:N-acetylmuramoyl-L-alanine amidase
MAFAGDPVWLEDVLREALGDRLVVEGDWVHRGTGGTMGDIWGVMIHHTGTINETVAHIRDGVQQEHEFLHGPLAQCLLTPDGKCHLIAVGPCNHAGDGFYPGLGSNNGNRRLIAFECCWPTPRPDLPPVFYDPNERWSTPLIITMRDATAAVLKKLGHGSARAIGHKEYAPNRKIDPGNMSMDWFRGEVQKDLDGVVFPGELALPQTGPLAVAPPMSAPPIRTSTDLQLRGEICDQLPGRLGGQGSPQFGGQAVADHLEEIARLAADLRSQIDGLRAMQLGPGLKPQPGDGPVKKAGVRKKAAAKKAAKKPPAKRAAAQTPGGIGS